MNTLWWRKRSLSVAFSQDGFVANKIRLSSRAVAGQVDPGIQKTAVGNSIHTHDIRWGWEGSAQGVEAGVD